VLGKRHTGIVLVNLRADSYNRRSRAPRSEAIQATARWIEQCHNRRRLHVALGDNIPVEQERANAATNHRTAEAV
jgi:transposase InsO family protein